MVLVLKRPGLAMHDQLLKAAGGMVCHLLGRLGPGRNGALCAFRNQEGRITNDEDVFVPFGLQGGFHFHLVNAVGGKPVDLAQPLRALHPGGPDQQVRLDGVAVLGHKGIFGGLGDHDAGAYFHAQRFQTFGGGGGNPFAEYREDPRGGFDDIHLQVFAIQFVVTVEVEHGHGMVQLRGQFHPGGAAANDGHGHRLAFVVGMQAGIEEPFAEALRLGAAVHEQAVVTDTGGAEVIALAARGEDQVVVVQLALGKHFLAVLVMERGQCQGLPGGVHLREGAGFKAVVIKLRMGAVIHRIQIRINGAGGHFVKAGFPHMDTGGIHQGDVCGTVVAQLATELGDQGQAAGTTANDNNLGFAH